MQRAVIAQVSAIEPDREFLGEILRDCCRNLFQWRTLKEAREWLPSRQAAVVICEASLPDGAWIDILGLVRRTPSPPNLIVSSRLSDERLWAEVLNLGGYDLLATPFHSSEVLRAVAVASSFWELKFATATCPGNMPLLTEFEN